MIKIDQTKVVVKNQQGKMVLRGNCYAACIASILEVPITEVPNVEVLFHIEGAYWSDVMERFLSSKGYKLADSHKFRVFHDPEYGIQEGERANWIEQCENIFYLVSGQSPRGVSHMVIYKKGRMIHDPHPTKEDITTFDRFQYIAPDE